MELAAYAAGTLCIVLAALDLFLSVLYARSGTGLFSMHLNNSQLYELD